jgi:hypothetical protein
LDVDVAVLVDVPIAGFPAMLPAYSVAEMASSMRCGQKLLASNCKEFICVGPYSDELHDLLDDLLEDLLEIQVVTTSFVDEGEAAEYLIFGADGAESELLVGLVAEHPNLVGELLERIGTIDG